MLLQCTAWFVTWCDFSVQRDSWCDVTSVYSMIRDVITLIPPDVFCCCNNLLPYLHFTVATTCYLISILLLQQPANLSPFCCCNNPLPYLHFAVATTRYLISILLLQQPATLSPFCCCNNLLPYLHFAVATTRYLISILLLQQPATLSPFTIKKMETPGSQQCSYLLCRLLYVVTKDNMFLVQLILNRKIENRRQCHYKLYNSIHPRFKYLWTEFVEIGLRKKIHSGIS